MMEQARANGDRLSAMTRERAPSSTTPNWGITRLTTTDADREVRDWFVQACKARGCAVTIDDMDNVASVIPGFICFTIDMRHHHKANLHQIDTKPGDFTENMAAEGMKQEHVAAGADGLLNAVLSFDRYLDT